MLYLFGQIIRIEGERVNRVFSSNKYKALLASFCALGWSVAYPLIKIGYSEFQILPDDLGGKVLFAGVRFFIAGLLIIAFCHIRKTPINIKNKNDYYWIFLLGFVNTTLHYMFAYIGLGYNSGARSTILDSLGSFLLIILSALFLPDDKINFKKAIGCILGFFGIILATIQPNDNIFENITFLGDGMILLNAIFAALGGIITRIVSKKMNIMPATGISMALGGGVMIIFSVFIGLKSRLIFNVKGLIILLILILISAVCFAIYNELLSYYPISEISIFNALIPVLGVFFSAILLKEEIKWQYICAVIIVAIGIIFVNYKPKITAT